MSEAAARIIEQAEQETDSDPRFSALLREGIEHWDAQRGVEAIDTLSRGLEFAHNDTCRAIIYALQGLWLGAMSIATQDDAQFANWRAASIYFLGLSAKLDPGEHFTPDRMLSSFVSLALSKAQYFKDNGAFEAAFTAHNWMLKITKERLNGADADWALRNVLKAGRDIWILEQKMRDHYNSGMPLLDLDVALEHVARNLGRPVETVRAQLGVDDAARETTARAKAKPRGKALVRGNARTELNAARLKATYEILVRESDLANPKFSDEERMSRAIHLRKTYDRLRKLDPSFRDKGEQLRLARKLLNSRAYQRRKAAKLAA